MTETEEKIPVPTISVTLLLLIVSSIFLFISHWKKRWIYYYGFKIPGPLSLPLIGSVHIFIFEFEDIYQKLFKLVESYSPIAKVFIGMELFIATARPEDVEVIANSSLEKSSFYKYVTDSFERAMFAMPVGAWKKRRNLVNHTFSSKVLNSFEKAFVKYSKHLVDDLGKCCGTEQNDLTTIIWQHTLDTTFETIMDVNPILIKERYEIISLGKRLEALGSQRFFNFLLHVNFIWRLSSMRREFQSLLKRMRAIGEKVIDANDASMKERSLTSSEDTLRNKLFLNKLVELEHDKRVTHDEVIDECMFMMLAASETTAIAINNALLILGLYPNVQEKLYQEVCLILGDTEKDITYKDINQMNYVEWVIKETMRLIPVIAMGARSIDKNIQLGEYVAPAGSHVVISIALVHKNPDIWPNPQKFDPERFSPEEVKKRHRCAFIPFSFGPRNCIALQYGMLSMKILLADIVKRYRVKAVNYQSIEDIHLDYFIVAKPKPCYSVILERRG